MLKRLIGALLILCMAFAVLLVGNLKASAANEDDSRYILRQLITNKRITGPEVKYQSLLDKPTILVLSLADTDCPTSKAYLPKALSIIKKQGLEDKVNVLFFDGKSSQDAIKQQAAKWDSKCLTTYSGGIKQVRDLIKEEYINYPVVVYCGKYANALLHRDGSSSVEQIEEDINKWINDPYSLLKEDSESVDENAPVVSNFKVLSDNGQSFIQRQEAILSYYKELAASSVGSGKRFAKQASYKAPYDPGELTPEYLNYATKTLNFVRFLAGVSDNITTTKEHNELAQKGALLLAASEYSHTPRKPKDMSDDLYQQGYRATSASNIAFGYSNLNMALATGWMNDGDTYNISQVGHRRVALEPMMQYASFGDVNGYYTMYATVSSRTNSVDYDAVAYPGGAAFPSEYFGGDYPWSVMLNMDKFQTPKLSAVKVTLTGGGKTYDFSAKTSSFYGNYLTVNTAGYVGNHCIIFRPSIESYKGEYTVKITGLKTKNGENAALTYTVNFFSIKEKIPMPKPTPDSNRLIINKQPAGLTRVSEGSIQGALTVDATVGGGKTITYEWALLGEDLKTGTIIAGETGPSLTIPTDLKKGTHYYICKLYVDGMDPIRTNFARVIVGGPETTGLKKGLNVLSLPTKTNYVVGEGFDISGLKVVFNNGLDVIDLSDKVLFYTSNVKLTQGRPFETTGKKVIVLKQLAGGKIGEYTINVTNGAVPTPAPSQAVKILAVPTKTTYKLGEGFDTTGLKAVLGEGASEVNVNSKITFYTSNTVQLTQDRKFTTTGTKVVEIRYDGKKVSTYTITVTK